MSSSNDFDTKQSDSHMQVNSCIQSSILLAAAASYLLFKCNAYTLSGAVHSANEENDELRRLAIEKLYFHWSVLQESNQTQGSFTGGHLKKKETVHICCSCGQEKQREKEHQKEVNAASQTLKMREKIYYSISLRLL